MTGNNVQWRPYNISAYYSLDLSLNQSYTLDYQYPIVRGTNNFTLSSGWEYGIDFPTASANNFLLANTPFNITQNPFSYWMKVQFKGTLKDYHLFGATTVPDDHWVKYDNSTNRLEYYINDSGSNETAYCSWTPSIGVNYFLTVTYDGTNITFYIDGIAQTTTYTNQTNFNNHMSNAAFAANLGIGFVNTNGGLSKLEGLLYGVGIKTTVLTANEIDLLNEYYLRN